MNVGWDKDTSKAKTLQPTIIYYLQAVKQFYLSGLGATSFTQRNKKKTPSQTRESDGACGPLSRGALVTERAPRDRCRLPSPSRCLDGRVATSVPTAARIAAAELGLPRGRRALSCTSHTDAQGCATQLAERRLQSASLV